MATKTAPPVVHKPSLLKHHEDAEDAIAPLVYLEEAEPNKPAWWYLSGAAWAAMHDYVAQGTIVYRWDSRYTLDGCYYWLAKDLIQNDYPQFIRNYKVFLAYLKTYPNKTIPVPPSPANDDSNVFFWKHREEQAFGPLDFTASVF